MLRSLIRKLSFIVLVLVFLFMGGITSLILAGGITTTTNTIKVTILNTTGSDVKNSVVSFRLSSQSLVDIGLIKSSAFNSEVHEGNTDIVYMPGTLQVQVEAAFNNASVDETTAANNSSSNDIIFPTADTEVVEFGLHNPATILIVDTSTVTDATWTITWEYYNGSSWSAFANVIDGTKGFTSPGIRKVSWDMPSSWPNSTLHSIESYWVRARVSAFTSSTVDPLGRQIWYETGQWTIFIDSLDNGRTTAYDVYYGGSTDLQTFYYYFPGNGGVIVTDTAALELGNNWDIDINGFFDVTTSTTGSGTQKDIFLKAGAMRIYPSAGNQITISITGSGVNTFFSASTDAGLSNYDTTFERASDELIGGTITTGTTGSSIGQTFNNTLNTTQSIGSKLDDPT